MTSSVKYILSFLCHGRRLTCPSDPKSQVVWSSNSDFVEEEGLEWTRPTPRRPQWCNRQTSTRLNRRNSAVVTLTHLVRSSIQKPVCHVSRVSLHFVSWRRCFWPSPWASASCGVVHQNEIHVYGLVKLFHSQLSPPPPSGKRKEIRERCWRSDARMRASYDNK